MRKVVLDTIVTISVTSIRETAMLVPNGIEHSESISRTEEI